MATFYVVSETTYPAKKASNGTSAPREKKDAAPFKTVDSVGRSAFDILETSDCYELWADAPGFSATDVNVELVDKVLTITAKLDNHAHPHQQQTEDGGEVKQATAVARKPKVWLQERYPHTFSRSFHLPDNAETDNISANLDKGVLVVRVPKLPEPATPEPRRIQVQSAAGAA